jgi:hypothetical protein
MILGHSCGLSDRTMLNIGFDIITVDQLKSTITKMVITIPSKVNNVDITSYVHNIVSLVNYLNGIFKNDYNERAKALL